MPERATPGSSTVTVQATIAGRKKLSRWQHNFCELGVTTFLFYNFLHLILCTKAKNEITGVYERKIHQNF